jgi:hypothetical protein
MRRVVDCLFPTQSTSSIHGLVVRAARLPAAGCYTVPGFRKDRRVRRKIRKTIETDPFSAALYTKSLP